MGTTTSAPAGGVEVGFLFIYKSDEDLLKLARRLMSLRSLPHLLLLVRQGSLTSLGLH